LLLQNKEAILSILRWVNLFLSFHKFGIYIHNETCVASGEPEKNFDRAHGSIND
jgi:hypothetical protein